MLQRKFRKSLRKSYANEQFSGESGISAKQSTAVDNGICKIKGRIASFLVLCAIVAHVEMHRIIVSNNGCQQLTVAFAGGLLVLFN